MLNHHGYIYLELDTVSTFTYFMLPPLQLLCLFAYTARFQQGILFGDRAWLCMSDSPSPSFLTNAHSDFRSSSTDRAGPQLAFINNGQMLAVLTLKHSLPPFLLHPEQIVCFSFSLPPKRHRRSVCCCPKSYLQLAMTMHDKEKAFLVPQYTFRS